MSRLHGIRVAPVVRGALVLGVLSMLGLAVVPRPAIAAKSMAYQVCSKRVAKAFKRFGGDALEMMGDCQLDNFKDDENLDCSTDEELADDLVKAGDKLRREARKCKNASLRQVCPHGATDDDELKAIVLTGPGGTTERLRALDAALFSDPQPGCSRPQTEISREAEDCVARMGKAMEDGIDELAKCLLKCELTSLRRSGQEDCTDQNNGEPVAQKIEECLQRVVEDVDEELARKCDGSTLTELGCPLGFDSVPELAAALSDHIYTETVVMADGIFRSPCSSGGNDSTEPGTAEPAAATLYPSATPTTVTCGQELDAAFFGTDDILRLDGNLNCSSMGRDSTGLTISASNVTVDGRGDYDLTGPSRSGNRTGPGILIADGATNVRVRRFRKIQRYAVGVLDTGSNVGLNIEELTVRRNRDAGIRTTSRDVTIADVKSERNPIGFDISGDDSSLIDCRALRAEPAPGYGVRVFGSDIDSDGRTVRINRCEVEGNMVGIRVEGESHLLEDNYVRSNSGNGIEVAGRYTKVESSSVKLNAGSGIVILGDENEVTANSSDENQLYGYVVTGANNDVNQNGAGSLTDHGNWLAGYLFAGTDSIVESNEAEANLGSGFLVAETTAEFSGNSSSDNATTGFEIVGTGNVVNSNVAERNAGHEFSIVAGNIDDSGNRSNGATFSFGIEGGDF